MERNDSCFWAFNYAPNFAVRFDLQGIPQEIFGEAYRIGQACLLLKGRRIPPGVLPESYTPNIQNDGKGRQSVRSNAPNRTNWVGKCALKIRARREFRPRSCRREHSPQRSLRGQAPFQCPTRARVACQAFDVYRSIGRFLYAAEALRTDIEKFYALESNLSESPRSWVPYFCYLLSLRRSRQQGESPCE